jgi:sugar phosphate isomerase/epimerase
VTVVGIDNYSFHRLLGEVRPGESDPRVDRWPWERTIEAALAAGADLVALESVFMDARSCWDRLARGVPLRVMLSWGHPYGLEYGGSPQAEDDARRWLRLAADLGHERMRIVIAHPHLRSEADSWGQVKASVPALFRLAEQAQRLGVILAIENHADLTAEQLVWLMTEVGSDSVRICLDTANALRVGDDPLTAARLLAPWTVAAHVKDLAAEPWHPRSGPRSVPLGTGTLPVAQIVADLLSANPACWLMVEWGHLGSGDFDEESLVRADVAWLREHAHQRA